MVDLLTIFCIIFIALDMITTHRVLLLGFEEANPLVLSLITTFGVTVGLVITYFIACVSVIVLNVMYSLVESERWKGFIYFVLLLILLTRAFVSGFNVSLLLGG